MVWLPILGVKDMKACMSMLRNGKNLHRDGEEYR